MSLKDYYLYVHVLTVLNKGVSKIRKPFFLGGVKIFLRGKRNDNSCQLAQEKVFYHTLLP